MHAHPPQSHQPLPVQHPAPPRTAKPRRRIPWLLLGGIGITGFAALLCVATVLIMVVVNANDTIAAGVTVAGVDVGGMSRADAQTALSAPLANQTVAMIDGVRRWDMSYRQLGLNANLATTLDRAEAADNNETITPQYILDINQTQRALVDLSMHTNIDAIPGRDAENGRALDIPATLERIRTNPLGALGDGQFELEMIVIEPPAIDSIDTYTGAQTTHVIQQGQELGLIAKEYGVPMADILALNDITDANLIYPGQSLTIPAGGIYEPSAADAPPAPLQNGKAIVVDTSTQRIYAYEDGELLRSHLVSTGRAATPTLKGDYNIYVKLRADDMSGPGYFVPQVPWTMYYYQGYAIHGAYWHNSFGRPMSHGCVNLPTEEAEWLFNWAEVGTLVRVI